MPHRPRSCPTAGAVLGPCRPQWAALLTRGRGWKLGRPFLSRASWWWISCASASFPKGLGLTSQLWAEDWAWVVASYPLPTETSRTGRVSRSPRLRTGNQRAGVQLSAPHVGTVTWDGCFPACVLSHSQGS